MQLPSSGQHELSDHGAGKTGYVLQQRDQTTRTLAMASIRGRGEIHDNFDADGVHGVYV